ncbi:Bug family tripartite tricarboxylate transporter substrate binding protein [Muricoccus pecuniae]|uniref:Tripartite-type tricarboxylate transporter receptor subunit TctC n=1 Tax=Muricoccus pecuniae TaxID=693023 RepID=A0A840Y7N1_9PROT|nr:tripartite tricarboxylate transporter substrate binding protein [Roseomonas pecuniae]MBB5692367.1 tripartite-type tricarboxylate transporter receptor subunit TctC [Roseomonas pecuniae]
MSLRALWVCFGVLLAALPARAQEYPTRPIRVVVPFAAGGSTDILARVVTQSMSKRLGQPMVVENRAGAGGNIGSDVCAKAAPDGYTLCISTISAHAINASVYPQMPYDNLRDFWDITLLATQPNLLVVNSRVPARNLNELIAMLKAKPGEHTYGSSGVGTSQHLGTELLLQTIGTTGVHVPYRGSSQSLNDLIGGQLTMVLDNFSSAWPLVQAGQIRALGVGSQGRNPSAPDLPAIAEVLPGFESVSWSGLFAPAAVPRPIIDRLNREARAALQDPEVLARFRDLGLQPGGNSPEEFHAFVEAETKRWGEVARRANIRAE